MNPLTRRVAWLAAWLGVVITAGLGLHGLATLVSARDLTLVRDLASERTSSLTTLAHGVSWLGRSTVLVPAAVVTAVVVSTRQRARDGAALIVGVVGAIIIQNVDKAIVGRPRPPVNQLERVAGTSFPSGHATEASAFFLLLAIVLTAGSPPRSAKFLASGVALILVSAVGLSRVYLGVHYPTDVAAGMLLGGTWAAATATALLASGRSHLRW